MDLQESALLSGQNYKSYYSKSKWQQAFLNLIQNVKTVLSR
jgi:hypothetical protein